MDQQNTNPSSPENKGSMGPLIGSIIIIIVLIIGAIYFWGDQLNKKNVAENSTATPIAAEEDLNSLENDLKNIPETSADINNL